MHDKWIKYKGILLILGIALIIGEKYSWWLVPDLGFNLYFCVFIFILPSLGTLFVLPYLSQWRSTKSWLHKPITYISLISYSMYLLNFTVMAMYVVPKTVSIFWPSLSATQYAWVATGLYWLFNVVCSILIYKYFEIPFMKLRDRFKSTNT
jgi:peptidoglycan/LPS O-acetylase OafA/YrhL